MSEKLCIYCGKIVCGSNKSFEHAIPRWLLDYLQVKNQQMYLSNVSRQNESVRDQTQTPNTLGRNICRSCNNNWLSQIDKSCISDVKHVAKHGTWVSGPLFEGSYERKLAFSTFVYKICLNFFSTSKFSKNYARYYKHFFEHKHAIEGTVFFLSSYATPSPLNLSHSNNWMIDRTTHREFFAEGGHSPHDMFKFFVQFQNVAIVVANTGASRLNVVYDPSVVRPTFMIGADELIERQTPLLPSASIHQDNPITRVLESISAQTQA